MEDNGTHIDTPPEIYEILERVANTKGRDAKCAVLRENRCSALTDLLRCAFDDSIIFTIPTGAPPYTPRAEDAPGTFRNKNVMLSFVIKGGRGEQLAQHQRERKFIDLIESIHPEDAKMLILAKDKKAPAKSLTKKLVEKAFPGLIRK